MDESNQASIGTGHPDTLMTAMTADITAPAPANGSTIVPFKKQYDKQCESCGAAYVGFPNQKYCSKKCKDAYYRNETHRPAAMFAGRGGKGVAVKAALQELGMDALQRDIAKRATELYGASISVSYIAVNKNALRYGKKQRLKRPPSPASGRCLTIPLDDTPHLIDAIPTSSVIKERLADLARQEHILRALLKVSEQKEKEFKKA